MCWGLLVVAIVVLVVVTVVVREGMPTGSVSRSSDRVRGRQDSQPPSSTSMATDEHPWVVTVDLKGGLGNQLFQVATAYAYARQHHLKFVLDHSQKQLGDRRTYFDQDLLSWTTHDPEWAQRPWQDLVEKRFNYDPLPAPTHPYTRLVGYFQSDRYFDTYHQTLIRKFRQSRGSTLDPPPPTAIALHIRRGDYVNHSFHTQQSAAYYQQAVAWLEGERHATLPLCVFSDDPAWCRQTVPTWFPQHGIQFWDAGDEVDQLWAMSQCRDIVMANSSYSWWGTYLALPDQDQKVVAPRKWFNDNFLDWSDVYRAHFHIMP